MRLMKKPKSNYFYNYYIIDNSNYFMILLQ